MRVLTPLFLLTLSAYVQAETLPSFLNSNDTIRNLPVPNLPADAYRPVTPQTQVPQAPATQNQPLQMDTKVTIRKLQIEGGTLSTRPITNTPKSPSTTPCQIEPLNRK